MTFTQPAGAIAIPVVLAIVDAVVGDACSPVRSGAGW